ncbi:MAG: response regulator [Chloroflexi bacterium]|nr:response regulator [Chloroflexota bacterium]
MDLTDMAEETLTSERCSAGPTSRHNGDTEVAKKILIVDDDEAIQRFYSTVLESHGYEVLVAENGQHGLKMVYRERPDLIISDLDMPKMNGYEFCKIVRLMVDVPFLMISGSGQQVEKMLVVKLLGSAIECFLTKPIDIPVLLEEVAAALDKDRIEGVPALH